MVAIVHNNNHNKPIYSKPAEYITVFVSSRKVLLPATSAQVSWFPCAYKQMLRWFPRLQVATTCFSRSPPDLNLFKHASSTLKLCLSYRFVY